MSDLRGLGASQLLTVTRNNGLTHAAHFFIVNAHYLDVYSARHCFHMDGAASMRFFFLNQNGRLKCQAENDLFGPNCNNESLNMQQQMGKSTATREASV